MPDRMVTAAVRRSFHTDPSGMFVKHEARAIGSGSEGAQSALEEGYRRDMTLAEAEVLALATLKQVMEEKVSTPPLRPCPLRPLLLPSSSCPRSIIHV